MNVDLDRKGAELVGATRPSLLGPEEVRRRAQRRRHRRRLGWIGAAGALTALVAVLFSWSSSPDRSSVHVTSPTSNGVCTGNDLVAGPARVGPALGSLVATLTINGTSSESCQVPTATAVELLDAAGSPVRADYSTAAAPSSAAPSVAKAVSASVEVQMQSHGGYPDPSCTQIRSIRLHFGARVLEYAVDSEACSASASVPPAVFVSAVMSGSDATASPPTSPACDPKQHTSTPC